MEFRRDINGLRAIAVIAVVLFHFNEQWVPGGFAGVDVFFVISGFLMTGIIFRGLEQDNFSLLKFYMARANRIIPALAMLCLFLAVCGWFILTPLDYKGFGKHLAASIGFISNIVYLAESGYFNPSSLENWLLHTWSLSVEWQFYIIYSLVLVLLRRYVALNRIKVVLCVATLLGFACSIATTYVWKNGAYFLLPSRAWAMMLGGVAYFYPVDLSNRLKKIVEALGAVLVLSSFFLISKDDFWPGYIVFFPVMGVFLMIQARHDQSVLTGNILFQKLGSWSYSIYLWHWPIVVAIAYFKLSEVFVYCGILLSILLGFLSYKFIERYPFSRQFSSYSDVLKSKPVWFAVILSILGVAIYCFNGFLWRVPLNERVKHESALEAMEDWYYPDSNLTVYGKQIRLIKGQSDKNILLIGSSHIMQIFPYAEHIKSKYNIYFLTKNGCFVTPSYINPKWGCSNIQDYKALIENVHFDKIVTSIYNINGYLSDDLELQKKQIAQRTQEYDDFLAFAKQYADKVYMLLGEPKGDEFDPKVSIRYKLRTRVPIEEIRALYETHYQALNQLESLDGVNIIDPLDYLCDTHCDVMDSNAGFYYRDSNHMRPGYAIQALHYLEPVFME